jgi:hypothetical protein
MGAEQSSKDVLVRMLSDILFEAEAVRLSDPVRAAKLDEAANDLRMVIAEPDETASEMV